MKKTLKNALLALTLISALTAAGVGLSACDAGNFPDYKLQEIGGGGGETEINRYTVQTLSVGGIKLSGILVTAKKGGEAVKRGISDENGKVVFALDEGVYDLEYDNLPDGYYVGNSTLNATPEKYGTVEARFPSKIITNKADPGNSYKLGDVMYDFRFKDSLGNEYLLSELLDQESENAKKAVVLNFWYTTCGPCQSEIPYMQQAYAEYGSKAELIAVTDRDSNDAIESFKTSFLNKQTPTAITFPMGYDENGLTNRFGVTAFPTTVVVDRYGTIVLREEGSMPSLASWRSLFDLYTAKDYTQEVNPDEEDEPLVREKPSQDALNRTPDYASEEFKEILCLDHADRFAFHNETDENDSVYNWPWVLDENRASLEASNTKTNYSFANVYGDVRLETDEVLSFEYNISVNEAEDTLYVLVNRKIVLELSGDSSAVAGNENGWVKQSILASNKNQTIELAFCYLRSEKSGASEAYKNTARIRNFTITNATASEKPVDVMYDCASDANAAGTAYTSYMPVVLWDERDGGDGYYYVTDSDGNRISLLYVDILNETSWSLLNLKSATYTTPEGTTVASSLYQIAIWEFSNLLDRADDEPLSVFPDYPDTSDEIIEQYYLQTFSKNGYTPATPALKAAVEVFLDLYCQKYGISRYENQWLEFCVYFRHFDGAGGATHEDCYATSNPIKGLGFECAEEAHLGRNHADIWSERNSNAGIRYAFTPTATGTYHIYSAVNPQTDSITDPFAYVVKRTQNEETGKYEYNIVYEEDESLRYDRFSTSQKVEGSTTTFYKYGLNFDFFYHFEAGETVYLQLRMFMPGVTGEYDFYIEQVYGEEAERQLMLCTTGEGSFSPIGVNESLEYLSIAVAFNPEDELWYPVTADGEFAPEPVYIDLVHGNFLDNNGYSVYDFIRANVFTAEDKETMMRYYLNAVAYVNEDGSAQEVTGGTPLTVRPSEPYDETDNPYLKDGNGNVYYRRTDAGELYGMAPADRTIVNILDALASRLFEISTGSKAWLSMACYYLHFE